jgi:hypothetical protein
VRITIIGQRGGSCGVVGGPERADRWIPSIASSAASSAEAIARCTGLGSSPATTIGSQPQPRISDSSCSSGSRASTVGFAIL